MATAILPKFNPTRKITKITEDDLVQLHTLVMQARDLSVKLAPHDGAELESITMSIMAVFLPAMHDGILEKGWALHKLDPKPAMVNYRNARYRHRLRRAGDLVPGVPIPSVANEQPAHQ